MSLLVFKYRDHAEDLHEVRLEGLRFDADGRPHFLPPGSQMWALEPEARSAREHVAFTGLPAITPADEEDLLAIGIGGGQGNCGTASKLGFTWHEGTPALSDLLYLLDATGSPVVTHTLDGWRADSLGDAFPYVEIRIARTPLALEPVAIGPRFRLSPLAARR
jgi:hypothetical protein